jgi:hypothetical protein
MPTSREECLAMLDQLIIDMATLMTQDEFAQLYQNMPFDLAIKRDCENENFGSAHQTAVGMRPTEASPTPRDPAPSNCFLTTACCDVVGLADDCLELTILRRYRDLMLPTMPGGRAEIALYYVVAPAILANLHGVTARQLLKRVYFTHILPCVVLAWLGLGRATRRRYRDMLARLWEAATRPALS